MDSGQFMRNSFPEAYAKGPRHDLKVKIEY